MRTVAISILLAAGAALGSAAYAQEAPVTPVGPPASSYAYVGDPVPYQPQWSGAPEMPCCDLNPARGVYSLANGVAALEANDFTLAEEVFTRIVRYNRNDPGVRFYLGVAKMNLGKWDEAERYLRSPVRKLRKLADPKSHLGVTYARLGDVDGAYAQRAALVRMSEACKGTCELAPSITEGIQMIDEALAQTAGQG